MVTSGSISVGDGVEIAYTSYGNDSPHAVLISPGLGATQLGYAADAQFLASNGRRVVCFDQRGLGRSTRPSDFCKEQFTPAKLAGDALALARALDIRRADVIGHSLGGLVGLEAIAAAPELFRSLITYGTTYELNYPSIIVPLQALMYKLLGKKRLADFVAKKSSQVVEAQDLIREQFADFPTDVGKMMSANIYRYSYLKVLDQWNGPVLMLKGALDLSINNNLDSTLERLRQRDNFELVEIPNAGHFTNLDAPQPVQNAIERFLRKLDDL